MRKVIAAMNMTIDGYCDHTAGIADEQLHEHFTELLRSAGVILYGRITYHLMEDYWPEVVKKPTGTKSTDEFAIAIENIPKIVFSHTLRKADLQWKNVTLATGTLEEEVSKLRQQSGNDILVGSPSLIAALTKLNLIDEFQLCIHPVIAGSGLTLFKNITDKIILKRLKTKTFASGTIAQYYEPIKK